MNFKFQIDERMQKILITTALIVGLICSIILCGDRVVREANNLNATIVMTQEDAEFLGAENGMTAEEFAQSVGLTLFTPGETCESLNLWISDGQAYEGEEGVIGLVEDENQYSFIPIPGFDVEETDADLVRVFKLIDKYAARYAALDYTDGKEIENILYRAVTDRNIRVLWLTPFVHSETGHTVTDLEEYQTVVENLKIRVAEQKITIGQEFSVLRDSELPSVLETILKIGCMWGVCGGFAILWLSLVTKGISQIAMPACLLLCIYLGIKAPWFTAVLFSPCSAVVFASLAMWYMVRALKGAETTRLLLTDIMQFLKILLGTFFIALMGGLYVGAFQNSRAYLLAIDNFSGVKASALIPIAYVFLWMLKEFYGREGLGEIRTSRKSIQALFVVGLIGAVALFVLRTGDGMIGVSTLEQTIRNELEQQLLVRPRTKEFLVAWPCLGLAFGLIIKNFKHYAWPFIILTAPGAVSVINTFCHARAPIWLSVTRSFMGLGFGIVIACLIIALLDYKFPPPRDESDRIYFDTGSKG